MPLQLAKKLQQQGIALRKVEIRPLSEIRMFFEVPGGMKAGGLREFVNELAHTKENLERYGSKGIGRPSVASHSGKNQISVFFSGTKEKLENERRELLKLVPPETIEQAAAEWAKNRGRKQA